MISRINFNLKKNKFFFTDGEAKVEILVVTHEIIRVRLAPHGVFLEEFSYAVPKLERLILESDDACWRRLY